MCALSSSNFRPIVFLSTSPSASLSGGEGESMSHSINVSITSSFLIPHFLFLILSHCLPRKQQPPFSLSNPYFQHFQVIGHNIAPAQRNSIIANKSRMRHVPIDNYVQAIFLNSMIFRITCFQVFDHLILILHPAIAMPVTQRFICLLVDRDRVTIYQRLVKFFQYRRQFFLLRLGMSYKNIDQKNYDK